MFGRKLPNIEGLFDDMAEDLHAEFSANIAGRIYSFVITCDKSVVKDLCVTAVTLYSIYTTHKLLAQAIDGIVNRGLGGPRQDQDIGGIKPGSLHVKLHCFTDERFLEVWSDFESGRMKARLQEEFTKAGIDVDGLKIEIENMNEVNDTMRAIESRQKECKTIGKEDKIEELVKDNSRKLNELRVNQERIGHNIKISLKNLKQEIIDEMQKSQFQLKTLRKITTVENSPHTRCLSEVIAIGGSGEGGTTLASVEKIQLGQYDAAWVPLPSMNVPRTLAASVVIGTKVNVVGGGTEIIEILDVGQRPLQWIRSKAVLPFPLFGHSCVVYDGKLIVIGGYNLNTGGYSNEIHEVLLAEPYSSKLLCTLPTPIGYHGTEMINDKIYIFGGKWNELLYDDILVFDPVTNECKELSKLPYPLRYMSTVQWENKVVLLGGESGHDIALKEVIMFDPMSGECTQLPPMGHARRGAAAVTADDVVVVMGGWYESKRRAKSVECFNLSNKTWNDLPPMKEARAHVTAVFI